SPNRFRPDSPPLPSPRGRARCCAEPAVHPQNGPPHQHPSGTPPTPTHTTHPMTTPTAASAATRLADALSALTLEEKVQLLTGRDFWNTWPIEKIGLRRILVSDGPSGVRGEHWAERGSE